MKILTSIIKFLDMVFTTFRGEVIDRKFVFIAVNPCKKAVYDNRNAIVFAAKDAAVPDMLRAYIQACIKLQCDENHIDSVSLLLERVNKFHMRNGKRIPDTDTECEIDRCIGGNL